MSILSLRSFSRRMKLIALATLAAGAVLMAQSLHSRPASADVPGPGATLQPIIVGGQLSISTNKHAYYAGEWIQVCYKVPAPGPIQIRDYQGGSVKTLLSGYDDGTGGCFWGQVTPPYGHECLVIHYSYPYGGSISKHTCFQVLPHFPFPFPY